MLAGWIYFRYVHEAAGGCRNRAADIELPTLAAKAAESRRCPRPSKSISRVREDLRAEVDRILDKINSDGFGA